MAEAEWYKNPYALLGATAGVAIAIPAGIALAPPVIAGLGVIGGAAALTALGAGVIATTFAIGKHIDEAIEANNSPETIKKILEDANIKDDKKIEDIKRIAKAKKDNIFLKLFDYTKSSKYSEEIVDIYKGALDLQEVDEKDKVIKGLRVVNKLDQLRLKEPDSFLIKLTEYKKYNELGSSYELGQKITKNSEAFFKDDDALKENINNVQNFFDFLDSTIAVARKVKIRRDFTNSTNTLSTIYQYKILMGLNILSDDLKSKDDKIKQLTKLMSIQSSGKTQEEKIQHYIAEFTNIETKAPDGAIATDTPWPKALRVFAQAILSDTSSSKITDQDRILALDTYLKELKSGASDVSPIQKIRQRNDDLIDISTKESAADFLKRISEVSVGADGKKDISLIKAFNDDAAAAAVAVAVAAAADPAATRTAARPGPAGGGARPVLGGDVAAPAPADGLGAGLGGGPDGVDGDLHDPATHRPGPVFLATAGPGPVFLATAGAGLGGGGGDGAGGGAAAAGGGAAGGGLVGGGAGLVGGADGLGAGPSAAGGGPHLPDPAAAPAAAPHAAAAGPDGAGGRPDPDPAAPAAAAAAGGGRGSAGAG